MSENKGKIVSLSDKGFGFIEVEGRENRLFFHAKDLVKPLRFDELVMNDEVVFDGTETTERGEKAVGVTLA